MLWKRIPAYGARESGQLRDVWRAACRQSGLVALAFALIYARFGEQIIALLTSLPALRELASHYLIWQVILPVVGSGAICWTVCLLARREERRCVTAWRWRRLVLP